MSRKEKGGRTSAKEGQLEGPGGEEQSDGWSGIFPPEGKGSAPSGPSKLSHSSLLKILRAERQKKNGI